MSEFDLQPWPSRGDDSQSGDDLPPVGGTGGQQSYAATIATITSTSPVMQSNIVSAPTGGLSPEATGVSVTPSPDNSGSESSDLDRKSVIVLSTVLSVVGVIFVVGAAFMCLRCRRRRSKLFNRGITPIDDEEIETWKSKHHEKQLGDHAGLTTGDDNNGHTKKESVSSTRKSSSVIVYSSTRRSEERSPRTPRMQYQYGKRSLDGRTTNIDKELPQTPIQARAPNAREGLTDEAVPGDDPFIYHKRQNSRLSKTPPRSQNLKNVHTRTRSSFSLRSLGDHFRGYDSDVEFAPRTSDDYRDYRRGPSHKRRSQVFSSSSIPPRLSLSNDWPASTCHQEDMIGRAIG